MAWNQYGGDSCRSGRMDYASTAIFGIGFNVGLWNGVFSSIDPQTGATIFDVSLSTMGFDPGQMAMTSDGNIICSGGIPGSFNDRIVKKDRTTGGDVWSYTLTGGGGGGLSALRGGCAVDSVDNVYFTYYDYNNHTYYVGSITGSGAGRWVVPISGAHGTPIVDSSYVYIHDGSNLKALAVGDGAVALTTPVGSFYYSAQSGVESPDGSTIYLSIWDGGTLQITIKSIKTSDLSENWSYTLNSGGTYAATSITSVNLGTGSRTFVTQAGLSYIAGDRVRATSSGTGYYVEGAVVSYSGTTLVINVDTWWISDPEIAYDYLIIGTGPQTFTAFNTYAVGDRIRALAADMRMGTGDYMEGIVTSDAPGVLEVNIDTVHGAGDDDDAWYITRISSVTTEADWDIDITEATPNALGPAMDSSGNIYVENSHGILYCINSAGALAWKLSTTAVGPVGGSGVITKGNTIYVIGSSNLVKVNNSGGYGSVAWVSSVSIGSAAAAWQACISESGTALYIINGNTQCITAINTGDGSTQWTYSLPIYYGASIVLLGSGGDFSTPNTATVFGYVFDPVTGLGGSGSGEVISGATITIGTQPPAITDGTGFYTITFSSNFAFNNPTTPLTVSAPNMKGITNVMEVPANTSSEVDFYMIPTYIGSGGSGGGGRTRRSGGTFRNPLNMLKGLKMKIK